MQQFVNGHLVDVPTDSNGSMDSDALRKACGIPASRPLIMQNPDGSNKLINPGEKLQVNPGQRYLDSPIHERGGQPWHP
jgi:hypothetical protein